MAEFHSGFVALVGRPNVGKSTLVNRVLGQKVSITSSRPQTTRHRIAGVHNGPGFQLVLLDIPGFQKPRDTLTQRMQSLVDETLRDVDAVLFLLNGAETIGRGDRFIAEVLSRVKTPVLAAVNKADLLSPERAAVQLETARALGEFRSVHLVSALDGAGLDGLVAELAALLPEGPEYFPAGVITDQPEELLAAEFIREKVIALTAEEVPHAVAVEVLEFGARPGRGLVDIRAAIYVERESQKPIVLGEAGARIKRIGVEARREIERLLGTQVFLELVVKVRRRWRDNPGLLDNLGL
ncbi:MAG: GTPase Era [Thermoleophilia bacterium]